MRPVSRYLIWLALPALSACPQPDMEDQPKYETYEAATEWPGQQSARTPPAGTVARDRETLPPRPAMSLALLEQGRHAFNAFCSPCHGRSGRGDGMVVQRGFPAPPDLNADALRSIPARRVVDVITHGHGVMVSYADRVPPGPRWAIAAYVQALQRAQHVPVASLSDAERRQLEALP